MTDRPHENAGAHEELLETGHLAFPQGLRDIDDQRREARPDRSLVGGKEDVSQKALALFALTPALHLGLNGPCGVGPERDAPKGGKIAVDTAAGQRARCDAEQAMCRRIRQQNLPVGAHREDRRWTRFYQKFQLLFGCSARGRLLFDLLEMLPLLTPVPGDGIGEKARSCE